METKIIEVTHQEAWIDKLRLHVYFKLNGIKLNATALMDYDERYLTDVEVMKTDDQSSRYYSGEDEHEVGRKLLEKIDLDRYLID